MDSSRGFRDQICLLLECRDFEFFLMLQDVLYCGLESIVLQVIVSFLQSWCCNVLYCDLEFCRELFPTEFVVNFRLECFIIMTPQEPVQNQKSRKFDVN